MCPLVLRPYPWSLHCLLNVNRKTTIRSNAAACGTPLLEADTARGVQSLQSGRVRDRNHMSWWKRGGPSGMWHLSIFHVLFLKKVLQVKWEEQRIFISDQVQKLSHMETLPPSFFWSLLFKLKINIFLEN